MSVKNSQLMSRTRTSHQFHNVGIDLLKDQLNVLRLAFFELLLKEAAAMLVLAQAKDFILHGFESHVGEA